MRLVPTWEAGSSGFEMSPTAIAMRCGGKWDGCSPPANGLPSVPTLPSRPRSGGLSLTAASRRKTPGGSNGWQTAKPAVRPIGRVARLLAQGPVVERLDQPPANAAGAHPGQTQTDPNAADARGPKTAETNG